MSGRPFTTAEDSYIREHYSTQKLSEIAVALGRHWGSVQQRSKRLQAAGFLTAKRAHQPPWAAADVSTLDTLIHRGVSDKKIAEHLGRTETAVRIARKRHRLPPRRKVLLSSRGVADLLGIRCSKTVAWWIHHGWLKARRGQRAGPNRQWYVGEAALTAFLEEPAYWHLWRVEDVRDKDFREWAGYMRKGRFLTTREVAERYYVGHQTVNSWIRKNLLPARKHGANWLIREEDLVGFVAPCERSRSGRPRRLFTAAEDREVLQRRAAGETWDAIATALGREIGTIAARHKRLLGRERKEVAA